jgi:hypothetical protein
VVHYALRAVHGIRSTSALASPRPDGLRALEEIARRRGITRAEAARRAIAETAERERRRSGLAEEARRLMKDPTYVDEAREVAAMMEEMRGSW